MQSRHHRVPARLALAATALLTLVVTAGCSDDGGNKAEPSRSASASRSASPTPSEPAATLDRKVPPAADAGGLCREFTYDAVEQAVGVAFDVAAASGSGKSQACTLRRRDAALPDLTLSFASGTTELEAFRTDIQPKDAKNLDGAPGKGGYRMIKGGGDGAGPAVEIGWVGGNGVYTLIFTTEPDTSDEAAEQYVGKLTALGKTI